MWCGPTRVWRARPCAVRRSHGAAWRPVRILLRARACEGRETTLSRARRTTQRRSTHGPRPSGIGQCVVCPDSCPKDKAVRSEPQSWWRVARVAHSAVRACVGGGRGGEPLGATAWLTFGVMSGGPRGPRRGSMGGLKTERSATGRRGRWPLASPILDAAVASPFSCARGKSKFFWARFYFAPPKIRHRPGRRMF